MATSSKRASAALVDELVERDRVVPAERLPPPVLRLRLVRPPEPLRLLPEPLRLLAEPLRLLPEPERLLPELLRLLPEPLRLLPEPLRLLPEPLRLPEPERALELLRLPELRLLALRVLFRPLPEPDPFPELDPPDPPLRACGMVTSPLLD